MVKHIYFKADKEKWYSDLFNDVFNWMQPYLIKAQKEKGKSMAGKPYLIVGVLMPTAIFITLAITQETLSTLILLRFPLFMLVVYLAFTLPHRFKYKKLKEEYLDKWEAINAYRMQKDKYTLNLLKNILSFVCKDGVGIPKSIYLLNILVNSDFVAIVYKKQSVVLIPGNMAWSSVMLDVLDSTFNEHVDSILITENTIVPESSENMSDDSKVILEWIVSDENVVSLVKSEL